MSSLTTIGSYAPSPSSLYASSTVATSAPQSIGCPASTPLIAPPMPSASWEPGSSLFSLPTAPSADASNIVEKRTETGPPQGDSEPPGGIELKNTPLGLAWKNYFRPRWPGVGLNSCALDLHEELEEMMAYARSLFMQFEDEDGIYQNLSKMLNKALQDSRDSNRKKEVEARVNEYLAKVDEQINTDTSGATTALDPEARRLLGMAAFGTILMVAESM